MNHEEEEKTQLDNSFGDHSHKSDAQNINQLSTPSIKQEDNKEQNISSDTANFFHTHKINNPTTEKEKEKEPQAELSFDDDSAIVNFPMQIISNDNQNEELSSASEQLSRREQSISTTTQATNYAHLIRSFHIVENQPLKAANSSFSNTTSEINVRFSQLATLNRMSNRGTNLDFVEKIEEGMDNILYVLNTERMNINTIKSDYNHKQEAFKETIKVQNEQWELEKWQYEENQKQLTKIENEWKEIVHLDIGGTHKISTTMSTLTKFPQSAIAVMFNGRHNIVTHKGRYFIDRDGATFAHVIEYLRTSKYPYFANKSQEAAFLEELDYWQIPSFQNIQVFNQNECNSFDALHCSPFIHLEQQCSIARKHCQSQGIVVMKRSIEYGNPYVEIKVTFNIPSKSKNQLYFGLVNREHITDDMIKADDHDLKFDSFLWSIWEHRLIKTLKAGKIYYSDIDYGCYCDELEQKIGMMYDKANGNVSFYKNGLSQGFAFMNISTGLYPILILNFESGHIEILPLKEPHAHSYL